MTLYEYFTGIVNTSFVTCHMVRICQNFTVGTVGANEVFNITQVSVKVYRINSPGDVYFNIYNIDGATKPTGAPLSTGTYNADAVTTNAGGESIIVPMSACLLQPNTEYAFVVYTSLVTCGVTDQLFWKNGTGGGYAGGVV